jgi:hypothetical protein
MYRCRGKAGRRFQTSRGPPNPPTSEFIQQIEGGGGVFLLRIRHGDAGREYYCDVEYVQCGCVAFPAA